MGKTGTNEQKTKINKENNRATHKQNAKEDHNDKITRHNLQNYCWKLMNAFYVIISLSLSPSLDWLRHVYKTLDAPNDSLNCVPLCSRVLCYGRVILHLIRRILIGCALNVFIAGFEAIDLLVISTINQMERVHFFSSKFIFIRLSSSFSCCHFNTFFSASAWFTHFICYALEFILSSSHFSSI